jgi:hypothetical protein
MKEIDFLPEWYKSGKRRQVSYRTQYLAMGCALLVMVVWSFVTARSISRGEAELRQTTPMQDQSQGTSLDFDKVKSRVMQLKKQAEQINKLDSKINIANVLAELSYLVREKIVLSDVEFVAEEFEQQHNNNSSGSAVRPAGRGSASKTQFPLGAVRFKVMIKGVASDASDVAELVIKLEDSPYFRRITSSWRNGNINTHAGNKNLEVSEFEIGCYLANYRRNDESFAKETQHGLTAQ